MFTEKATPESLCKHALKLKRAKNIIHSDRTKTKPGSRHTFMEDVARAVMFIVENKDKLMNKKDVYGQNV